MPPEKANKEISEQWRKDPSNWKLGIFYYNKNDKRIFCPKRFGWGWTVNFANPRSVFALLLTAFLIGIVVSISSKYYLFGNKKTSNLACTQEAMICPDGSSVGRTGPNCTFAPCLVVTVCKTDNDCKNGASCLVEGPLIANQPVKKVCVSKGKAVPL